MKKYFNIIIVVLLIFILFHFVHLLFSNGKVVNYVLSEGKYKIHEEYVRNTADVSNHYYLEIKFEDATFNFRVSDIFKRKSYIVDEVYSFKNEQYICVLPVFVDGSIQTDILCKKGDIIYPYKTLQNQSLELDKFAASLEEFGYLINQSNQHTSYYGIDVIKNNLLSDVIVIPSYKGIYIINKKDSDLVSSIELFEDDIYNQKIQSVVSNYYLVADYNSSYSFREFKLVDLNSKKVLSIVSDSSISMDSYVQGIVDDCVYIIDKSNRKQYKIDVSNKTVTLVGNIEKGILYHNGVTFENISIYKALDNELLFSLTNFESSKYDYVNLFDGIYYSYLNVTNGYNVYISYKENTDLYSYGFWVPLIDKVKYAKDSVYYVNDDTLYCYTQKNGVVKILSYDELFYNSKLNFWVY